MNIPNSLNQPMWYRFWFCMAMAMMSIIAGGIGSIITQDPVKWFPFFLFGACVWAFGMGLCTTMVKVEKTFGELDE